MMTEPLSAAQRASIGWRHRQGVGDMGNQFHYYRLTADGRILWGGYDAVYYNGGLITAGQDQRPATFARLAGQFFETFPQLGRAPLHPHLGRRDRHLRAVLRVLRHRPPRAAGLRRRATPGWASAPPGSAATCCSTCSAGSRPSGPRWAWCAARPVPFPPEPLRSAVIQLTRASLARADRHEGRRDLWLRTLDRLGLGFDS